MTDNYLEEMREAFVAWLDGGYDSEAFLWGCRFDKGEREGSQAGYSNLATGFYAGYRVALSRLSAQAEPAKDAREHEASPQLSSGIKYDLPGTRDRLIFLLSGCSWTEPFVRACFDKYDDVQARLSASGQGEERYPFASAEDRAVGWTIDFAYLEKLQEKIPIDEDCGRVALETIESVILAFVNQPAAPAPEKGEVKRCAWCGGVFSLTADGYLTCGKCGKQIKPGAYRDPSEIEMHTPADDFYKPVPAQPAPSEEQMDEETARGLPRRSRRPRRASR